MSGPTKAQKVAAAASKETSAATHEGPLVAVLRVASVLPSGEKSEVVNLMGHPDTGNNFHQEGEPPCINVTISITKPEMLGKFKVDEYYAIELNPVEPD